MDEIKGYIYKNGKFWACKFRVFDTTTNKYKQITRSTGIRIDDATPKRLKLSENKARKAMESIIAPYNGTTFNADIYLEEYMKLWLERHVTTLQETTRYQYIKMFEKHIYPYWHGKNISLRSLNKASLESYYSIKQKEGLSSNTVIKFHNMIHTALKDACCNEYISHNVADYVRSPKKVKPKHSFYTEEQLKQLLVIAKGTTIEVPIVIACVLGLRRSEIIGLRWSSIDFKNRVIKINGKVVNCHNDETKDKYIYSEEMKNDASESTYPMTDFMFDYLITLSFKQQTYNRTTDKYIDYVCVNEAGELIKPDYVSMSFKRLLATNNMPHIRFHDLRHSCISLLNKHRFTMKDLQSYARHEDMATTQEFYAHSYDETKMEMQSAICDSLFNE